MFSGGIFSTTIGILFAMWLFYWRPERKKRKEQQRKERAELERSEVLKKCSGEYPDPLSASDEEIESFLKELPYETRRVYVRLAITRGREIKDEIIERCDAGER